MRFVLSLAAVALAAPRRGGATEAERHRHPVRRRRVRRVRVPGEQGDPHAEHRLDRQERRAVHAGLRRRHVLLAVPGRAADRPVPDAVRARVQRRRADRRGKGFGLPVEEKTIADRLKALGLRDRVRRQVAPRRRAEVHRHRPRVRRVLRHRRQHAVLQPAELHRHPQVSPKVTPVKDDNFYTTDAYAERAVDWIGKQKDKPFFLYLPFNAQHAPLQATEEVPRPVPEHRGREAADVRGDDVGDGRRRRQGAGEGPGDGRRRRTR